MTTTAHRAAPAGSAAGSADGRSRPPSRRGRRIALYIFLAAMSLSWIFPIAWALFNSFRDYAYTSANGYVSFGGFTLDNYTRAWREGDFGQHFWNSVIITVPSVLVTLLLASMVAFVVARFSFRFNIILLMRFTAANLQRQFPAQFNHLADQRCQKCGLGNQSLDLCWIGVLL